MVTAIAHCETEGAYLTDIVDLREYNFILGKPIFVSSLTLKE